MRTPIFPAHVADALYLVTIEAEGTYNSQIVRGNELLRAYLEACYGNPESADPDGLTGIIESLQDANCWHVAGDRWVQFTTEFEDGEIGFYLIADAIMPGEPRTAEQQFIDRDRFMRYIEDNVQIARLKQGLAVLSEHSCKVSYDIITSKRYRQ